jgi:hypothetical protein
MVSPTEYIQGKSRNRVSVSAHSAGAYTTTLYVMVDTVKGGGSTPQPSPDWANFSIMMECTPESGHCHSVCTLWSEKPFSVSPFFSVWPAAKRLNLR